MLKSLYYSVFLGLLLAFAGLLAGCAKPEPEPWQEPARQAPPPQRQVPPPQTSESGDVKARKVVNVTLNKVNDAVLAGVFKKTIAITPGVARVERQPGNPRAGQAVWNVHVGVNDPFKLRVDIIKTLQEIFRTNGRIVVNGVTHHYTPAEVRMLKRVVPDNVTARGVHFSVQNSPVGPPPKRR